MKKLAIIGLGYVGLPLAVELVKMATMLLALISTKKE